MHDGDSTHNGHQAHTRDPQRSVGVVVPRHARFDEPLRLRSGASLPGFTLEYETYGTLNAARDNAVLICHALSGDAHVAGYHSEALDERPGWWDEAVGPGKMFDTRRFFVICSNVLGGCRGSTGPASLAPDGTPWALRFPVVTVGDMVQAQARLMDRMGIARLFAVAGGSMGGMQALEWALQFPERVAHVLFIASTARSSAQNIAFNAIGRAAIMHDPRWNGGDYADGATPDGGLAVARMVGHITYMSDHSLETKFGRRLHGHDALPYQFDEPEFAVESYLGYQGEKFVQRFDANSYLYITKALDYFDIADGYDSMEAALARTEARFLIVSFSSDWLYTEAQARELTDALRRVGRQVEEHRVQAVYGHDSFLVEVETMTELVGGYLNRHWDEAHMSFAVNGARVK